MQKDISKKEKKNIKKEVKIKKRSILCIRVSLLFIPLLISLLIISTHSKELINSIAQIIIFILLLISIIILISSIIIYSKRRRIHLKKGKIFKYIFIVIYIIYVFIHITFITLLYGPINTFKDWLVTTAMNTKDHKYFCTWLYSNEEIDEVKNRNYIKEPSGSTDERLVNTEPKEEEKQIEYANEYERQVLTKDEGNDLYKIINLEVNGCKAYLAVIYDPSKVGITTTDKVGVRGQYVTTMAKRENALVAINGAGFYDPGYTSSGGCPKGITIVDGKIITNNEYGRVTTGGLIGLTKDNKLVLLRGVSAKEAINQGVRDAVSWGPFLVVNGKAAYTKGNGGWGYAARTAIGQRKDGIILFLVVDSNYNRTKGADMSDLTEIMVNYGAVNATNLDGGTSSVMVVNGEMISHPIDSSLQNETRPIATSFIVTK